jgi:SAM-dependent methyltransferase
MAMATASARGLRSKCFLCDEVSDKVVWFENGIEGLLCRCGMLYSNQFSFAAPVDLLEEHHPDEFYSLPAEFKAAWVAKHCPPGRLLEVGCGPGFFLAKAREYGYQVQGLEPSLNYDEQLSVLDIPVVHARIEHNELPKHSFDVVYHCDLLAHFPDPLCSLSAMCDLLRPGGVLCFEVGFLGGVSPLWYRLVGTLGLGPHLWLYSAKAFRKLLEKAQLQLVRADYFGLIPQVVAGRAVGVFSKRALAPALEALGYDGKSRSSRFHHSCENLLRYRVGRLFPHLGPQTVMVVARPFENA